MDIPNVLEDVEAMISQDHRASSPSASRGDNDDKNISSSGKDFDNIHAGVVCGDSNDCDDDDSSGNNNDDNKDNNSENSSTCRNQLLLEEQIEFLHEKQALLQRASHALAVEEIFDASNAQTLVREVAALKRSGNSSSSNNNNNSRDDPTGIWEEARTFLASLEDSSCGFSKDRSTASLPMPTMKYSSSSTKRIVGGGEKIESPADPSIDITTVERMPSEQYDLLIMPLSEGGEDWQRSLPVTG